MDKKKIKIISVCVVIAVIIVSIAIYFISRSTVETTNENRLSKLYERMMRNEMYSITFKLNDTNQYTVSRKGNMANIDTYDEGTHTANIVKDGNTILLMYHTNRYYTYQNNEIALTELPNELNDIIQTQEPQRGTEKIDGKKYQYEEYKGVSYFLMEKDESILAEEAITRFYFDGDNLKFIKTITENESEQIEVNVSFKVDDNLFEIPEGFEEG